MIHPWWLVSDRPGTTMGGMQLLLVPVLAAAFAAAPAWQDSVMVSALTDQYVERRPALGEGRALAGAFVSDCDTALGVFAPAAPPPVQTVARGVVVGAGRGG